MGEKSWMRKAALLAVLAVVATGFAFAADPTLAQPAFRQTNQWMEQVRYQEWQQKSSAHFLLRYTTEDEGVAEMVLSEAEQVYADFAAAFQFAPEKPVNLVLYPDRESLQERFRWSAAQSATGVYLGGVIYLLSPSVWLYPEGEVLTNGAEPLFHQEGPLYHEYAHLYLDHLANNRFPRWYSEGLAQLIEYEYIGYEWLSEENILYREELYRLDELASFDRLENTALAYRQVFRWLEWMGESRGPSVWAELNGQLAASVGFDQAWYGVFGETTADSWQRFQRHVDRVRLR